MKTVHLNGQPRTTSASTVADLVKELGFSKNSLLVEHNGTALRPAEWDTPLADGDRLELLRLAAGG